MSQWTTRIVPIVLLGVVLCVIGGAIAYSFSAGGKPSDEPVDVVWDKVACAACGMHVGEPPFAAQLVTTDGEACFFDDPGCLFLHIAEHDVSVHKSWFRHMHDERWIPGNAVAFVDVTPTPMGFGLGAVDAGTPKSISYGEARQRCLQRNSGHEERR